MPKVVRNFWIELEVDGVATKVATGPRGKDGSFMMKLYIRSNGDISPTALKLAGVIDPSTGELVVIGFGGELKEVTSLLKGSR